MRILGVMQYAKLPSGTVVQVDDIGIARRMRPEELPEDAESGFILFPLVGSPRVFSKHADDVEALATLFDRLVTMDIAPGEIRFREKESVP